MKSVYTKGLRLTLAAAVFTAAFGTGLPSPTGGAPWGGARPAMALNRRVPVRVRLSVARALKWISQQQRPSGGYYAADGPSTAVTSLSVMAFLARGYTPGGGPYGKVINKAIDWVLKKQQANGVISASGHTMYDHGISTVMLSEVYGMVSRKRRIRVSKALAKAVHVILAAQKINKAPNMQGGWRYQPNSGDSDMSCTGWQLMALRGAAADGAAVPASAIQDALKFIRGDASPSGGFAYQPGNLGSVDEALTGTGVLSLELLGKHNSKLAFAGGDYLLQHPLTNNGIRFYYYGVYYCSQAMYQLGGRYWRGFYPSLRDTLLANQNVNGSWTNGSDSSPGGADYCTAMAVLALCVPYRYLPIYQR